MTKITQGEWVITPNGEWIGTIGQHKRPICKISLPSCEESVANAHLIAAAPDLLDGAEKIIHAIKMRCSIGHDLIHELVELEKAIVKAKGGAK